MSARALARGHVGALVGLAFAILGGSAFITVGAVLTETSLRAEVPPTRLADAEILVSAAQRVPVVEDFDVRLPERATVPADLVERVGRVPGVSAVAADVGLPLSITTDGVTRTVEAHPWPVADLGDPALRGAAPGPDAVVVDEEIAGIEVGDRLAVGVGETRRNLLVSGIVDAPGPGVHLATSTMSDLAALPGGASDLLAIRVSDDADIAAVAAAIEDVVGGEYAVTTGDARGAVESLAVGNARLELVALAASLAGTLLLLVGCIVASAMATSVANQRRELALLRAVGATPRQVRGLVARQATVAAACGLLPGVALGYLAAGWFCDQLAERGVLPVVVPVVHSPIAGLVVVALTLVVVQLAARGATFRASRRPATEAMGDAQVEPRQPSRVRTGLGLGLVVLSLAPAFGALVVTGEEAFLSAVSGTLLGIVGLALCGPALARAVTGRLAERRGERAPVTRWLALHQTHAYALRTAGAVTVLALAFGLTVAQVFAQSTLERATSAEQAAGMTADATITGALTAADVASLGDTAGVDAAVPMVSTSVVRTSRMLGDATTERFPALGLGPDADRVVDLDVAAGGLADLRGETVALDASTARRWGLDVGDRVELRLANGDPVSPEVVATYRRGFGFGTVVASTELLAAHGLARSADAALVSGDPAALDGWAASHPDHAVTAATSLTGSGSDPQRWLNLIVLLPMLGYVLVAVASSLRTTTRRRREEMSTLRMLGATPRQIRSMVTREALLLGSLAIAAGTVLSVLPMSILGLGVLARPWPQGPLWVIPAIGAVVMLAALTSMRGATRRILQRPPLTS
ncbi:FtsX-like permease family protein [Aeromicrobium sp. Marseille-Q0843]|uniref:FtsX-like permease family protein n=1 Tax=Aeromicrobium phoceense TaxID=2754045 RepID=A0A838XLK0_9ACTN|nr:ABC transporter permease [Aeromicrobium phoceense]MBA4609881.1 FtsX-like permease family protein [Aeromicrobium phoceense]